METDIAEGGHILCMGVPEEILELNKRLEPHKEKDTFLPFEKLRDLFDEYHVIVGAGHPFREGGHIPQLPLEQLRRLDFLDLNGKDIAADRAATEKKTGELGKLLDIPVVAGSDTHQHPPGCPVWLYPDRFYKRNQSCGRPVRRNESRKI